MSSARLWSNGCQTAAAIAISSRSGHCGPSLLSFPAVERHDRRDSGGSGSLVLSHLERMPPVDPIPELKRQAGAEVARRLGSGNAHDIAAWLGTDQPRISDLRRGKLDRFSLETLLRFVSRLDGVPNLIFEDRPRFPPRVRARR